MSYIDMVTILVFLALIIIMVQVRVNIYLPGFIKHLELLAVSTNSTDACEQTENRWLLGSVPSLADWYMRYLPPLSREGLHWFRLSIGS